MSSEPERSLVAWLALPLAALLLAGCESVQEQSDRLCARRGGVRELPNRYKVVVCNDGTTHRVVA